MTILHIKIFTNERNAHLVQAFTSLARTHAKNKSPTWRVTVVSAVDAKDAHQPHIIYLVSFPQMVDCTNWPPVKRILYQVEQFPHGYVYKREEFWRPFISPHVVAIWDYTRANVPHYPPVLQPKVHIVPFPPILVDSSSPPKHELPREGPVDVLFYGHGNARRNRLMSVLSAVLHARGIRVRYVREVYDDALWSHVHHAKVVLNLHYFDADTSYLETYRLNELLAQGASVVSELPNAADMPMANKYKAAGIEFVPAIRTYQDLMYCVTVVESFVRNAWRRQVAEQMGVRFVRETHFDYANLVTEALSRML